MRRITRPNLEIEGLEINQVCFNDGDEAKSWEKTLPKSVPPGCELFVNWIPQAATPTFDIGVRKINSDKLAKPANPSGKATAVSELEGLEKRSEPELKTIAGRIGVSYADKPVKGVLVERIRAKLQEDGK